MKIKILNDIQEKLTSHFQYNNRNYSIYKMNEIKYNLVDEDEPKIRKRLKKFQSISDIFDHLEIEDNY